MYPIQYKYYHCYACVSIFFLFFHSKMQIGVAFHLMHFKAVYNSNFFFVFFCFFVVICCIYDEPELCDNDCLFEK